MMQENLQEYKQKLDTFKRYNNIIYKILRW